MKELFASVPRCPYAYLNGVIIAMGGVNMGILISYFSPVFSYIYENFGDTNWFNASAYFTGIIGNVIAIFMVKYFGNRVTSFFVSIFAIVCFILQGLSTSGGMAFTFRCLLGVCLGLYSTISPSYILEVAPEGRVALFGFMIQVALAFGCLLIPVVGNNLDTSSGIYRRSPFIIYNIILLIPSVIQAVGILFCPGGAPSSAVTDNFVKIFKFPKQITIGIFLMFFLQFSGLNAVLSNLNSIVSGMSGVNVNVITITINLSQLLSTIASSAVVDRLGQRICWAISAAGQALAFFLMWAYNQFEVKDKGLFLSGLYLQQIFFGVGTGPVPFTKCAMMFPLAAKAAACAFMTAFDWLFGGIVVTVWGYVTEKIGVASSFLIFAIMNIISVAFGWFCVLDAVDVHDMDDLAINPQEETKHSKSSSGASPNVVGV